MLHSLTQVKKMAVSNFKFFSLIFIVFFIFVSSTTSTPASDGFLQCFFSNIHHSDPINDVIFLRNSSTFTSVLQSTIINLRFSNNSTPRPDFIITPYHESHVQVTVICAKKNAIQIRVRSGGHDYEGLSYLTTSGAPFIVVDLTNLRSIAVDVSTETAWVEAGAILGELYYKIAEQSNVHAFPAGSCPTVGVGGLISGGGFGTIFRKYGLAADHVVDAKLVDVNGKVLNRETMGEDLFWAIRGGGGLSFGIILSFRVKLVRVPPTVTVFNIVKTLDQGASGLFQKWQTIGHKLHEDLFFHVVIQVAPSSSNGGNKTIQISFELLFLGPAKKLVPMMQESFPDLELELNNCTEMSWIQSVLHFAWFSMKEPLSTLLNRTTTTRFFKSKSDYVKEPISGSGLQGLWQRLLEDETSLLILTPYGGKMSEIGASETPFPHRNGNLYKIQYSTIWTVENETEGHIAWMRRLYDYMEPYVSKSPRAAYLNYRDLDLGTNNVGGGNDTSYEQASRWGLRYFMHNFERLVRVKSRVDPGNFFRNEQSIPALPTRGNNKELNKIKKLLHP